MNVIDALYRLTQVIARRRTIVNVRDMTRTSPVSANFGWERGTPIDRYYIENFYRGKADLIRGRILEVGDASYSRRFSTGSVESFDVLHAVPGAKAATIIGDLTDKGSLPQGVFDCFICAQTFQYTFEIQKAVEGAHYLLRSGGVLLATVPGISQISRYDQERYGEYWRFTIDAMKKLFLPVFRGGVEVASWGNVLSATAFLQGLALEDLPDRSLLNVNDPCYQMIITVAAWKEI